MYEDFENISENREISGNNQRARKGLQVDKYGQNMCYTSTLALKHCCGIHNYIK